MFKCPSCGSEKFVNSCGPSGLVRTCKNPMCGGSLANANYSWTEGSDEFHTKEAIEAAQAPKAAVVIPKPKAKTSEA